jgi:FtsX-like permease family
VRSLSKSPALAAVAIFSLALGIGANVTVYSVVREMILNDVSAWRPDRLAFVDGANASYSVYRDLRSAGAFEDLAFHRGIQDRIWHSQTLVGLYASVSDAVSRRTREMGIRSALGASQRRIVWFAIKDGLVLLGGGAILGLALALAAIVPLADLLPNGVNPWDASLFSAIASILISTGAAAAWIPARRAAKVDPIAALRQE